MTTATEGRTYMIKSLVLNPDITSGKKRRSLHFPGNDYIEVETPVVVPNGKWVASRPSSPSGLSVLVGVDPSEIEEVMLDTRYGGLSNIYSILYICDRPFGFVRKDMPSDHVSLDGSNAYRSSLTVARQIYKGELGQSVSIPHVNYVRQPFDEHQKPSVTQAHQRRRGYGWVKLADLGEMTVGYNPDKWIELVLGYWQYSGHLRYENYQPVGTLVDTAWGSALDIQLGEAEFVSMTPNQFQQEDGFDLWIRRGFAFTILRLQALGVTPETLQTV